MIFVYFLPLAEINYFFDMPNYLEFNVRISEFYQPNHDVYIILPGNLPINEVANFADEGNSIEYRKIV